MPWPVWRELRTFSTLLTTFFERWPINNMLPGLSESCDGNPVRYERGQQERSLISRIVQSLWPAPTCGEPLTVEAPVCNVAAQSVQYDSKLDTDRKSPSRSQPEACYHVLGVWEVNRHR